jgi:hypothetical protein
MADVATEKIGVFLTSFAAIFKMTSGWSIAAVFVDQRPRLCVQGYRCGAIFQATAR